MLILSEMIKTLLARKIVEIGDSKIFVRARERLRGSNKTLRAYDRMAGRYIESHRESPQTELHREMAEKIGAAPSILEVGAGELTTLCDVIEHLPSRPDHVDGLELAWSRLAVGLVHAHELNLDVRAIVGTATQLPYRDNAFDTVFTHHCLEQLPYERDEALQELYRVTARRLVMFEPSFELGSAAQRRRMRQHQYVRGLAQAVERMGWSLTEYHLLEHTGNVNNRAAVHVVEKGETPVDQDLACPFCKQSLTPIGEWLFCELCGTAYPVLEQIPCVSPWNGVVASKLASISSKKRPTSNDLQYSRRGA